jgi:hypothetical protein
MSVVSEFSHPHLTLYPTVKELAQVPVNEDDEWYSTPKITLPNPSPTNINSSSAVGVVLPASAVVESDSHASAVNVDLAATEPQQRRSSAKTIVPRDPPEQTLPPTKKQRRKLERARRKREGADSTTVPAAPRVPSVEPIRGGPPGQSSSSFLPPIQTLPSELDVPSEQRGTTAPAGTTSPRLKAGVFTGTVSF